MPTIKILRTGTFTAMGGKPVTFTENDLETAAFAYNQTGHKAPIVLGHPKDDQPVYGWVDRLSSAHGFLFAEVGRVAESLVQAVRARRYANVSAAMHAPLAKDNPAPGSWYLKHVGLLGSMPPAIKGLGRVEFAEGLDSRDWLIGPAEFADAGLLTGHPGALPAPQQTTVEFACPDGLSADADRLRIHQAALRYQHAHGVGYLEAVRTVVGR